MPPAEAYLKRRRNILPVTYFQHRKYARKTNAKVALNSPANDIPQINDVDEIQNVSANNDVQMAQVEHEHPREVNENLEVQNVAGNNGLQIVQSKRILSREAELLDELDHAKNIVAKREKEMKQYEQTIQNLHSLLGAVDLTEDALNTYDDILMSNENVQNAAETIDDSSDESLDESHCTDKENHQPDGHNQQANTTNCNQTDMMFSFQHEFVENVNYFINLFIIYGIIAYVCLQEKGVRTYQTVDAMLPRHVVEILKALNENKTFASIIGDGKYIETLMAAIFSVGTIKMGNYDSFSRNKLSFIRGK